MQAKSERVRELDELKVKHADLNARHATQASDFIEAKALMKCLEE